MSWSAKIIPNCMRSTMSNPTTANPTKQYSSRPTTVGQSSSNRPPPYHGGVYLHPDYMHYNPNYGQPQNAPVWSLSQPLPHVMRSGMKRGDDQDAKATDKRPNAHQEEVPAADEPPTEHPAHNADFDAEKNQPEARVSQPDERGFFNKWGEIRHRFREPLAEWLGTTVAMTLGLCAGLQTYTSQNQAGSFSSLAPAWGFAFMIAIYMAGGVSGGHLNPAITISMAVWRGFPARKCMVYVAAQIVGSIPAGGIAYALLRPGRRCLLRRRTLRTLLRRFSMSLSGRRFWWARLWRWGMIRMRRRGGGMQAFILGILISVLVLALGYNSGGCFNGARDFGARLVALMAGWGGEVFREKHVWWIWGPWAADITGGLFGTFIYDLAIFTEAEGPINYPRRRRKRALLIKEKNQMVKLRCKRRKIRDVERAVREVEQ
ncbi:aquaglyceroporin, putative [Aspergillus fumigatus Af293]|uniref:Aquaglyceroporin, putative n=1 Tax=Aspergillus fumigatus (strain ATCC MYA-4609 / CBS 101355 / FGSC A1100 / Af293) TaxID=330879 RepID=Q4W991_ASPFU|nr:aquaglyceroporin, putative [Aspergillus fumigatus Af293]EAL84350.1 aquaglyceroporin, putative [Aspergillus fumigatus Af293]